MVPKVMSFHAVVAMVLIKSNPFWTRVWTYHGGATATGFFCPDFAIAPCSNRTDNNNPLINYLVPWTSSEVLKFDSADKMKKGRKMKITGQAFGVGVYEEEDEDVYNRDDMSRYDFSLANDGEFSFCKAFHLPKYVPNHYP